MADNTFMLGMAVVILTPLAFAGVFFIFQKIFVWIQIRRGRVGMLIFSDNRGVIEKMAKPTGKSLKLGKKQYKFDPKKMYRKGSMPLMIFKESSTDPLDPLVGEGSALSTQRLSELLIRSFNLGKISSMKKQEVLVYIVIAAMAFAGISAAVSFMGFQSIGALEGKISNTMDGKFEKMNTQQKEMIQNSIAEGLANATEIPVIS